jgi:hypothetical protein
MEVRTIARRSKMKRRQSISLRIVCMVVQTPIHLDDPAMTTRDGQD